MSLRETILPGIIISGELQTAFLKHGFSGRVWNSSRFFSTIVLLQPKLAAIVATSSWHILGILIQFKCCNRFPLTTEKSIFFFSDFFCPSSASHSLSLSLSLTLSLSLSHSLSISLFFIIIFFLLLSETVVRHRRFSAGPVCKVSVLVPGIAARGRLCYLAACETTLQEMPWRIRQVKWCRRRRLMKRSRRVGDPASSPAAHPALDFFLSASSLSSLSLPTLSHSQSFLLFRSFALSLFTFAPLADRRLFHSAEGFSLSLSLSLSLICFVLPSLGRGGGLYLILCSYNDEEMRNAALINCADCALFWSNL